MLMHEETGPVDGARTIELPQLTQRRRLSRRMILLSLRVRPSRSPLCVRDANRVRNDVEDRLELGDASAECFTKLFALADVDAGEKNPVSTGPISEHREGRLDESPSGPTLKRNTNRGNFRKSANRRVDLIGEIGERVWKRVVDRDFRRQRSGNAGQLTVASIRVHQSQIIVEDRDSERNRLEERLEPNARYTDARKIESGG